MWVRNMIAERITIRALYVVLSTLRPVERWSAARGTFDEASPTIDWLIVLAVITLLVSILLALWTLFTHKRSENHLRQKLAELVIINERQQQEIAKLKQGQLTMPESITNAELPQKEVQALDA